MSDYTPTYYPRQAVTRFTLDMSITAIQRSFTVTQGDTNRRWEVTLTDEGKSLEIPDSWVINLTGRLPQSGDDLHADCVAQDGRIVLDFTATSALTSEIGTLALSFDLFSEDGGILASPKVWLTVAEGTRSYEAPETLKKLSTLQKFIEDKDAFEKRLEEIEDQYEAVMKAAEEIKGSFSIIDVVSLPASDIDTEATYRVLYGTFILGKMLRNDSTCHMVEWDSVPTEPGESVINDNNGALSYVGYYNVKDNTVYGYFGNDTIEFLLDWVENSSLSSWVKITLKNYLQRMTAGWKTMKEIVSGVGSAASMSWGGVITSIEDAGDDNALCLYLYSKMYFYKNGEWIGLDDGVGKTGTGIGAEVFNDPDNVATGMASHAEGGGTAAEGDFSHAEGNGSNASGDSSHAEGLNTTASGNYSHAEGQNTTASGDADHAEGNGSIASGNYSHAEGGYTKSSGQTSHAEGYKTEASGSSAHAEGDSTKAIGAVSHAEGSMTTAGDAGAHAEGGSTNANAAWAHTEGYGTTVNGVAGHAEGQNTTASYVADHAEGSQTEATGGYSHSEGLLTKASAQSAHAEGESTKATASTTHAEGYGTEASAVYAHAEGALTVANGTGAHAEGGSTKATGPWSHAEGYGTEAIGNSSHAGGMGTIANAEAQTVIGKYNVADATKVFILGGGTSDTQRKNVVTVDRSGNAWYNGNVEGSELFEGGTALKDKYAKKTDIPTIPTPTKETWTFTLEDGTTVTKEVHVG